MEFQKYTKSCVSFKNCLDTQTRSLKPENGLEINIKPEAHLAKLERASPANFRKKST